MAKSTFPMLLTVSVILFSATTVTAAPPKAKPPLPVIIDTDIGSAVDDAFALALAVSSPEIELRGVTTVSGDTRTRAMIACRFLHAVGRENVPVAAGMPTSEPQTAGQYQYGRRPARKRPVRQSAVEFLYQQLKANRGKLTIVALGPLTNIAELLRKHPGCKGWIKRLVVMGGAVRVGYNGKPPAVSEWNIKSDVKSALSVFAAGLPLTVVPLDATATLELSKKQLGEIFSTRIPVTNELWTLHDLWLRPQNETEKLVLYDPPAVALSFTDRFFKMKAMRLTVDKTGMTRKVKGKVNCRVAFVPRDATRGRGDATRGRGAFLRWYVDLVSSRQCYVHVAADGKLRVGNRQLSLKELQQHLKKKREINPRLRVRIFADPKTPIGSVIAVTNICQRAGVEQFAFGTSRARPKRTNLSKPLTDNRLPRRVHVFEDYETDIERRWWLSGRIEKKNVPPSTSQSVPNRRCCRATRTKNFDAKMGDPTQRYRAVIFNPVPGPPMGPNTRLRFRYRLKGTDTLRVQIYSLSNGYHRFLTLTDLPQGKWRTLTVDMTAARRPDGSGGPLSENERIDDIQFYTSPTSELLIDDIVLYDAAPKTEKRPFPKRVVFTGWFDTGKQGKEWPGEFEIVRHEKPRTWKAARSVADRQTGLPKIDVSLRGPRRFSDNSAARFRYKLTGTGPIELVLRNSRRKRAVAMTIKSPVQNRWTELTLPLKVPATKRPDGEVFDVISFRLADKRGGLLLDDLLLFEP